jgi:hypothetical protein
MMQDMHKLTNHYNQEQEKMKNLKVMEVLENVVIHNNCKSNIMHAQINPHLQFKRLMNNNVRKAHKQNERFMKYELDHGMPFKHVFYLVHYSLHFLLCTPSHNVGGLLTLATNATHCAFSITSNVLSIEIEAPNKNHSHKTLAIINNSSNKCCKVHINIK